MILPWRHWHEHNRDMGQLEADKASAVAVLHGLHSMVDVTAQQVDVMQEDTRVFVVAATNIAENGVSPPAFQERLRSSRRRIILSRRISRSRSWIPSQKV